MLSFTLPDGDTVLAVAAELSDSGLDLVPAAVAAMVLAALSAALVITALRRREFERDTPHEGAEALPMPSPQKVDA
jgi:hypothetical protein